MYRLSERAAARPGVQVVGLAPAGVDQTSPADHLRGLAARVRRLGLAGRFDPETAYAEREEVAQALRRLAREVERLQEARPTTGVVVATPPRPVLSPERLAALLAAKRGEIDRLQRLLAEAARPRRRRRRPSPPHQLSLDLPETCHVRASSTQPSRRMP